MSGLLIIIDGADGTGKDTVIENLKKNEVLQERALFTREPGGTEQGKRIRGFVLNPESEGLSPEAQLLLFCADRAEHTQKVIIPALDAGVTVISNRGESSTYAYQLHAHGRQNHLGPGFANINMFARNGLEPDLFIILSAPHGVCAKRIRERGESTWFDSKPQKFFEDVAEGLVTYVRRGERNYVIVDATRSPDEVALDVLQIILAFMKKHECKD